MSDFRTVACESCNAQHLLERVLIGPHGTPVKCAACGAVFKVFPLDEAKLSSPVVWLLKDPAGNTTPFSKLGVLQKVIVEGRAGPDWELSRFGESWRKLGAIEGLRMFFDARK